MIRVITYGTYDLLHYGHIRLLERAKALGDYLIVGITADDFDKTRGKINVQQSLMERIEGVRATGLVDEIIVEEYEGQKIDDIRRFGVDIFTVGSDWIGKFDYLNEYCKVIYLPRTEGVSSSEIRSEKRNIRLGLVGNVSLLEKFINEASFVNGIEVSAVCTQNRNINTIGIQTVEFYNELLDNVDAVYIASKPDEHYEQIKVALSKNVHVLCETPTTINVQNNKELIELAGIKGCILMDSLKTAYSTAYNRLLVLVKSGIIGDVVSVESTCTSLSNIASNSWNSMSYWSPTAVLPVFNILGTNYNNKRMISKYDGSGEAIFTQIDFVYDHAVATVKVGNGVKSEGELIISGTNGYIYVPAPWWKTDYFEIRNEDQSKNKRYFYQLDGEGIRYELVAFVKAIQSGKNMSFVNADVSNAISKIMEDFNAGIDCLKI